MSGPRFEQVDLELQATPFSAMAKVAEDPVRLVEGRRAACDGGEPAAAAGEEEQGSCE